MLKKNNLVHIKRPARGQMSLEFIFSVIIMMIMTYSVVRLFMWGGLDIGNRQRAHEKKLLAKTKDSPYECSVSVTSFFPCPPGARIWADNGPMSQIDPYFSSPTKLDAYWGVDD